ncbi:InlB B-repeat-containing protein [Rhodoferax sp. U2-2l]|uniref:InlB B-repeat-containing protein n=1 Tax=Rhodoferax sp. U2-2l TaxID=2884000 RepID=UPI001D0AA137|nr:InlB B-repeat-containing protein [Rhodoferax sp. U2-2l]MCB8745434.1 InlB B-repeat-containing protein [Rhodoferax sp. U2-2l]
MKTLAHRSSGFAIIEALVALVVVGFGMLALAGMQGALTRNVDVAQQRTEAVRLAQEKMEQLRYIKGIAVPASAASTPVAGYWDTLANGSDEITTNAVFTRAWTFGGAVADAMRSVTVTVTWTDRANEAQSVTLNSVISKTDPADSGFLGFPLPQNINLKRPLNRNLSIPIPAIDIGSGKSAIKFGENGEYVVFDNVNGDVVQICEPGLTDNPTDAQVKTALTSDQSNCTSVTGYIVTGYIKRGNNVSDSIWNGLNIHHLGITRNAAGTNDITCQFGNAVDQNTDASIANYKSYLCVIPLIEPSPAITVKGPYNWSGKILISGPSNWNASGNPYFVCRYQYAATVVLTDVNQRNVQPYVEVNKSLDQQNYLVGGTNNSTSTTQPTCPTDMTLANVSLGVLHQDCRSASNGAHATDCPLATSSTAYQVTYVIDGSTTGTVPVDNNSYAANAQVTVATKGNLAKGALNFVGWNTSADCSGTSRAAGSTFAITANTSLYACWSNVAITYSVTYNVNGGSGTPPVDAASYAAGNTVTVQAASLTKANATFAGWTTSTAGTGTTYSAGNTFTINGNTTLYAKWNATTITLATPSPSWTASTLIWTGISNATGYKVSACQSPTTNDTLTPCTPSSPTGAQTAASVTAGNGNKVTYCYSVVAVGSLPYTDSSSSGVFCSYRNGGTRTTSAP